MATTPGVLEPVMEVQASTIGDQAPTPASGSLTLFANQNGNFYSKNSSGTVSPIVNGVSSVTAGTGITVGGTTSSPTVSLTNPVTPALGGTGVANGTSNTLTFTGNYSLGLTLTATTAVTLPTSGTLYGTASNSITSAQLATSLSDETGSGSSVFANSPTLVTPALGTPSALVLTNATGLPLTTGDIFVGQSGIATAVPMTGDVTISTSGVTTYVNKANDLYYASTTFQ